MKNTVIRFTLFTLSLCTALCAQTLQTWKSANGHAFEGTLLRMEGQNVILKGTDGNEVKVPLSVLDPDSQKLAASENAIAMENGPVFQHQNLHLRFSLFPKAEWLQLQFLKAGAPIENQSYSLKFHFQENLGNKNSKAFKVEGLAEPIEQEREKVYLRLKMENGVVIKFTLNVDNRGALTFQHEFEFIPEGKSADKMWIKMSMEMPALLEYDIHKELYKGPIAPSGVAFSDLPDFLADYKIRLEMFNGESLTIPYYEKRSKGGQGWKMSISQGKQHTLEISAPEGKEGGGVQTSFYGGKMPAEGFRVGLNTDKDTNQGGPYTLELK